MGSNFAFSNSTVVFPLLGTPCHSSAACRQNKILSWQVAADFLKEDLFREKDYLKVNASSRLIAQLLQFFTYDPETLVKALTLFKDDILQHYLQQQWKMA